MHSLVTIEEFDKSHIAQVAVLALEQAGIQCFLQNETIVAMDWFMANAVGGIKLQVAAQDATRAHSILAEIRENKFEREESLKDKWVTFRCSNCKNPIAFSGLSLGRVESCPKCGKYVDVPVESDPTLSDEIIQKTTTLFKLDSNPSGNSFLTSWLSILRDGSFIIGILVCVFLAVASLLVWLKGSNE